MIIPLANLALYPLSMVVKNEDLLVMQLRNRGLRI